MVLVFTGFASSLSEMGLGASLVQQRTISDRHLNTVFWVNVAAGTLLAILFGLAAPLIARFYKEPLLRLLTAPIALNLLLSSLNVVQNALLDRSLNFRTKFWISSISLSVSGIVGDNIGVCRRGGLEPRGTVDNLSSLIGRRNVAFIFLEAKIIV